MKFGEDWRGVFIRGDSAMLYAMHLSRALESKSPEEQLVAREVARGLLSLLYSAVEGGAQDLVPEILRVSDEAVQRMIPFPFARPGPEWETMQRAVARSAYAEQLLKDIFGMRGEVARAASDGLVPVSDGQVRAILRFIGEGP